MHELFHGVFPALLTPFDASGAVNYDALRELSSGTIAPEATGERFCGVRIQ